MPFIQVDDIKMYYELHGQGDSLVLIQGFTCNRLFWKELVNPLSKYFKILIFDNRGSGETDSPDGAYSIKQMAKDTVRLMQELRIENANIMGHSMGGAIVQQICLDFPNKIRKGIVCTSFAKLQEKSKFQCDSQALFEAAGVSKELVVRNILSWICSNAFLSQSAYVDKLVEKFCTEPFPQGPAGYFGQSKALKSFNSIAKLPSIKTPLLIIAGDEDLLTPLSDSELLAREIPGSELFVFKGQSHLIPVEKPQELIDLAVSFFK